VPKTKRAHPADPQILGGQPASSPPAAPDVAPAPSPLPVAPLPDAATLPAEGSVSRLGAHPDRLTGAPA
jgi:hypothetical protein